MNWYIHEEASLSLSSIPVGDYVKLIPREYLIYKGKTNGGNQYAVFSTSQWGVVEEKGPYPNSAIVSTIEPKLGYKLVVFEDNIEDHIPREVEEKNSVLKGKHNG